MYIWQRGAMALHGERWVAWSKERWPMGGRYCDYYYIKDDWYGEQAAAADTPPPPPSPSIQWPLLHVYLHMSLIFPYLPNFSRFISTKIHPGESSSATPPTSTAYSAYPAISSLFEPRFTNKNHTQNIITLYYPTIDHVTQAPALSPPPIHSFFYRSLPHLDTFAC